MLEVGGGPGSAAELVCGHLPLGYLLGVDRSAVAVARSADRNRAHPEAGRLELRQGVVADLEVPDGSFDLAFCADVNVFWTVPDGPRVRGAGDQGRLTAGNSHRAVAVGYGGSQC